MKPVPAWIAMLGPWIAKLEFREGGCEEADWTWPPIGHWAAQATKKFEMRRVEGLA